MFNKSFNLTQFVKDIPSSAARKQIWLSLVGSVNASMFGAADSIVRQLQSLGYTDFTELNQREFKALISGPETGASASIIHTNQLLYKVSREWAAELNGSLVGTPKELGTISSTITLMTGPQKERGIADGAIPLLGSLGIVVTNAQIELAKAQRLATDNQTAAMRRARVGAIEYVIDQVFASGTDADDDEYYSQLPLETKELLADKLMSAMNKALVQCVNNTLFGRTGGDMLGAGDHLIISSLILRLMDKVVAPAKHSAPDKPKAAAKPAVKRARKAEVVKPKMQRAPAPTQATTMTHTLDNGIRVTSSI